ncbi:LytR/AlgR family response regulator transcription factor [Niabella drilacis]|uniref:Two component transcriptional regulator, LytTR family n=1 Tax=Niabella drilacis (strain DSM 25811 / CCM 8410 / CCUG 62505 / LMG 26954 / E90) TaxID=1285928 RepID=A0A1G6WIZ9_NIADE|nr:LytTR family DNA-binding domain-containing protein [Niabella drilacis]SDD65749.1 two component transcriptional regulator, LytTR family [Niabella drilacis]
MRILIVDDEPAAANMLQVLINRHILVDKEVLTCTSPEEALEQMAVFQPTLLLLDVEMPSMNGFDLLNQADTGNFDVIFTTAYDKYAIKAIRFSALDYLLKPIDINELQNAINRHIVRRNLHGGIPKKLVHNLVTNLKERSVSSFKLALSTQEGFYFCSPSEIVRCEGVNNYTHFYFKEKKTLLISRTLKEFEDILCDHGFVRAHKSHLVNISAIERLDKEGVLWLNNGTSIIVSRRRKEHLIGVLAQHGK